MSGTVRVTVDASRPAGRLEHHWNYIGYDECNYTHSPGGLALLGKIGMGHKYEADFSKYEGQNVGLPYNIPFVFRLKQ